MHWSVSMVEKVLPMRSPLTTTAVTATAISTISARARSACFFIIHLMTEGPPSRNGRPCGLGGEELRAVGRGGCIVRAPAQPWARWRRPFAAAAIRVQLHPCDHQAQHDHHEQDGEHPHAIMQLRHARLLRSPEVPPRDGSLGGRFCSLRGTILVTGQSWVMAFARREGCHA